MNKTIYDFTINKINGQPQNFNEYKGKTLLIVNVASECGLTPQYEALEKIYEKYKNKGFEILAFPANEFGAQEPGSNQAIADFCTSKFGIKFTMFEKIVVKGSGQHELYKFLIQQAPVARAIKEGEFEKNLESYGLHREIKTDILWNFEKFLINKNGQVAMRFSPEVEPDNVFLTKEIEALL